MSLDRHSRNNLEIRKATLGDVSPLSLLLARAFWDDPFHRWIFPNDSVRAEKHHRMFALALRYRIPHGTIFITTDLQGVASWVSPQSQESILLEFSRLALPGMRIIGFRSLLLFGGMRKIRKRQPNFPHWYLSVIGVAPEHQGKGIGSALLALGLSECDASGRPAYLEATSENNRVFYERHGFRVIGEINLPKGPTLWPMLREPDG